MSTPHTPTQPLGQGRGCRDIDTRRAALAFDLAVAASRLRCARAMPPGIDRAREIGAAAEHHRAIQAALDALGRRRAHG